MLLRPPFIKQQDVKSQSSNPITHIDKQTSVKSTSKNKKKENSLGMKKNNIIGINYQPTTTNLQNYDSDNGSVHSVNSRKSKGKTKQSTLAIGKKQNTYQNMNQNSAYSIKNQNQKQEYEIFKLDSDDDNKSIGSHASKNSKKNNTKQNSLSKNRNSKVNVQLNYYYNQKQNKQEDSPKTYYLQEESKVQTVRLNQNIQPISKPLKYNQVLKNAVINKNPQTKQRRTEQVKPKQNFSPFQEITLKRQSADQEPVYKLKEPQNNNYKNNGITNIFGQKIQQNKQVQQPSSNIFEQKNAFVNKVKTDTQIQLETKKLKVDLQQSSTIQPQMISTKSVTKSRRNKIFDNENNSIANSSNIMTSRTNLEGSFERSRSKSKSKLGQLLKQSRQKKNELANSRDKQIFQKPTQVLSPVHNKTNNFQVNQFKQQKIQQNIQNGNLMKIQKPNIASANTIKEQSKFGGQKLGQHPVKMQQIKPKSIQNDFFDLGQSKQSDLNLSMSNKHPQRSGIKGDSVIFNFQPQKKKGISITSKEKPSNIQNKSLQSKRHLDRLMKKCQQNEQFLAKSILSNNSELKTSQKPIVPSPQLNKKQQFLSNRPFEKINQHPVQDQPSWHQIVKDHPAFQIKQVQRKQIRRPSQEEIKINQKIKTQQRKQYQSESVQTAKGPQILLQNPIQKSRINQLIKNDKPHLQIINNQQTHQNLAQQQKNRIIANIQRKSKLQTEKPIAQIPSFKTSIQHQQQDIIINNNPQKTKSKNLPAPILQNESQYIKQQIQTSSISHQLSLSQNGSERSRSNSQSLKKNKKKQSSLNIMKKHKVQVRQQSPRAQQSFYQESPKQFKNQVRQYPQSERIVQIEKSPKIQSSRTKVEYKKPNLINFQQSDNQQQKIKSKTDMNFYNYGDMSQKSMRPPSSKPPLSRKSGCSSSKSKSKAKQSTLNINMNKKQNKMLKKTNQTKDNRQPKKKKTLLDIAQDKQYEGCAGSDSQCSFNSRQSFGSVNSRGSKKSSSSKKQSTLPITIKNKATTMNNFRPSLNKIPSTASQVQIYENDSQSIYNQLPQQSRKKDQSSRGRQRQRLHEQMQQRTIVSKDTYFIDERGRLVKQDLVIQGNKVYGRNNQKSAQQMAIDRMRRSRQHHRSRSKSRDGSRSRLSKKNSGSSFGQSGYDSASSSNYFNGQNSNYGSQYGVEKQNLQIEQFVKPIEQPMISNQKYKFVKPINQRKIERQFYQNEQQPYDNYYRRDQEQQDEQQPVKNITLNELFGRNKKPCQNNMKGVMNNENNIYRGNINNKDGQRYGTNKKCIGEQCVKLGRKKSLSRTQKTFYNR